MVTSKFNRLAVSLAANVNGIVVDSALVNVALLGWGCPVLPAGARGFSPCARLGAYRIIGLKFILLAMGVGFALPIRR